MEGRKRQCHLIPRALGERPYSPNLFVGAIIDRPLILRSKIIRRRRRNEFISSRNPKSRGDLGGRSVSAPTNITKGRLCLPFVIGAGNRTRTCTLSQWNLNPPSLPIPPCPRVFDFIMGPDFCQCINARLRIAQTAHFFLPSLLTFPLVIAKIDSVWCTLPQFLSGGTAFH